VNRPAAGLTFVIAARDAADTIGHTLRAFQAQTRPDWNAIVVDDGSNDGTASAALAVGDPRITVERGPPRGVAAARNRGLALARTPLVCVTDADDVHDPAFFETLAAPLGSHDLATCAFRYAGPDLRDGGWTHAPADSDAHPPALLELNQFALGAIIARLDALRSLAHAATGDPVVFRPDSHVEDWDLLLRAHAAGLRWAPIIGRPLFTYRLRPASRTTGLRGLWADGLALITSHTRDPGPARRWTLRSLARAAVMDDRTLAADCIAHLGGLAPAHADTLAGALRFAVRRSETACEPGVPATREDWSRRLTAVLGGSAIAADAVARSLLPRRRWNDVAAAAAARLQPGQTLAIYGLGRNGREVLDALPADAVPYVCVDDADPPPSCPARAAHRMIRSDDLGPNHVVLVTPDDRAAILRRLGHRPVAAILLPEDLAA
jgi:hypothetical protein